MGHDDRVKRETTVVVGLLVVVAALAIQRHVITTEALLTIATVIPSIILHEVSHGVSALAFGDDTAKRAGRITLNPLKHVDPFGTIILPVLLAVSGLGAFGYAKPVSVDPSRMRNPRNDGLLVSLAGPATNVSLALVALIWLRLVRHPSYLSATGGPMADRVVLLFGFVNVILAVFNLLPIPPLDGSAVVEWLLPKRWWPGWLRFRQYSMPILIVIVLLVPGVLSRVFNPAIRLWARALQG